MAQIILFCILCFLSHFAVAEFLNDQKEKFEIVQIQKVHVSSDCKKKTKCQALTSYKNKIRKEKTAADNAGNPASDFCQKQGGFNLVLRNVQNKSYDFCKFKDSSLIDSWDLYYAHHDKDLIKETSPSRKTK